MFTYLIELELAEFVAFRRTFQVGALVEAQLMWNSEQPRLLVRSRENVLASLCPRTGQLLWRQVLELAPRGDLKLMRYLPLERFRERNALELNQDTRQDLYDIITVQGHAPALVRGWHFASGGHLDWEWSLMPLQPNIAEKAFWIYNYGETILYHVLPVWQSHLEITQYRVNTGQVKANTVKFTTPWIKENHCVVTSVNFVCLNGGQETGSLQLFTIDITADSPKIFTKFLNASLTPQSLQILEVIFMIFKIHFTFEISLKWFYSGSIFYCSNS